MDMMGLCPFPEQPHLDRALVDANLFPIKIGKILIVRVNFVCCDIQIVFLCIHRIRRKQHFPSPFIGIGNASEHINLAIFQLLHQIHPASFDILVFPASVRGNLALVVIAVARSPIQRVLDIVARIKPPDPYHLPRFHGTSQNRRRKHGE